MTREPTEMERHVACAMAFHVEGRRLLTPEDYARARAAIRAMRDPNQAMIDVAENNEPGIGVPMIYSNMIDAASPPETT